MGDILLEGKVYPFTKIRKGIYLGKRIDNRTKRKHIIITKKYHRAGPIMYLFSDYNLENDKLSMENITTIPLNKLEEIYAEELLIKYNIFR